jgi:hypothetical protein
MIRRIALVALAVLCVAGLVAAADKTASGTVKTIAADAITVTDSAAKDWTFVVDKETMVHAAGATHKMDKLKADGKPTVITEFVAVKKNVVVKYAEKDGKMMAKEIDVK